MQTDQAPPSALARLQQLRARQLGTLETVAERAAFVAPAHDYQTAFEELRRHIFPVAALEGYSGQALEEVLRYVMQPQRIHDYSQLFALQCKLFNKAPMEMGLGRLPPFYSAEPNAQTLMRLLDPQTVTAELEAGRPTFPPAYSMSQPDMLQELSSASKEALPAGIARLTEAQLRTLLPALRARYPEPEFPAVMKALGRAFDHNQAQSRVHFQRDAETVSDTGYRALSDAELIREVLERMRTKHQGYREANRSEASAQDLVSALEAKLRGFGLRPAMSTPAPAAQVLMGTPMRKPVANPQPITSASPSPLPRPRGR